jgi:DNA polymerase-1
MDELSEILQEIKKNNNSNLQLNDRILLIDGMNNFIRSYASNNQMDLNGNLIGGVVGFLKTVGYAIKHLNPTRCFIIFDGKGGNKRRRDIYPDYKKKRDMSGKYNRFYKGSKEDENFSMKWQFKTLFEFLDHLPIIVMSFDYLEGDDVISYISNNFKNKSEKIYINSTDKDFLQLVDNTVHVWNPQKKKIYDKIEIQNEYNVLNSNFIIYKSLKGDISDNINGIRGIGDKTIQKKLSILNKQKISFSDFIDYCKTNSGDPKLNKIYENKEIIYRNKQLMDLTNNDIMPISLKNQIGSVIRSNYVPKFNKNMLLYLFRKYGFYDLFKTDPEYWLLNTFNLLSSFSTN